MTKQYSDLAVAVDLISDNYQTSNPVILAEKIEQDLGLEFSIHQISDYISLERNEDYEMESIRQEYYFSY